MKLCMSSCIEYDVDTSAVRSTPYGKIASFYYISHETVNEFKKKLKEKLGFEEIIAILSNAKEFSGLPVRHNEDILNESLNQMVQYKLPKHEMNSPHIKANLLL